MNKFTKTYQQVMAAVFFIVLIASMFLITVSIRSADHYTVSIALMMLGASTLGIVSCTM